MAAILLVLVLLLLLSLAPTGAQGGHLYYVMPTEPANTTCPGGSSCHTLEEYAENSAEYFVSDVRMVFLPGVHILSHQLAVRDVTNVTFVSLDSMLSEPDVHIVCHGYARDFVTSKFKNVSSLKIEGLNFGNCVHHTIWLINVTDFQLLHVISGQVQAEDLLGNTVISGSAFHGSNPDTSLFYTVSYPGHHQYNALNNLATIKDTIFNNGGILLYNALQNLTMTNVTIHHGNVKVTFEWQSGNNVLLLVRICDTLINKSNEAGIQVQVKTLTNHVNIYINKSEVIGHRYSGIKVQLYSTLSGSAVTIENSNISDNAGTNTQDEDAFQGAALTLSYGTGEPSLQDDLLVDNVFFGRNIMVKDDDTLLPAIVALTSIQNVTIVNCMFSENTGTPILVYNSSFYIIGTHTFVNNTSYQGGALAFYENSHMYIQNHTYLMFKENHAEYVGGAIYVSTNPINPLHSYAFNCHALKDLNVMCFMQFGNMNGGSEFLDVKLDFTDNTAGGGGSTLYGERLNMCQITNDSQSPYYGYKFFGNNSFVSFTPNATTDLSLVTSDPSRVCLCTPHKMIPDCDHVFYIKTVYPGESVIIPAAVVGQNFGTVDGSVYSQFMVLGGNRTSPELGEMQQFQGVSHHAGMQGATLLCTI